MNKIEQYLDDVGRPIGIYEATRAFEENKKIIAYFTKDYVSILAKISLERYGFIYIGKPCTPKFQEVSAMKSIRAAINHNNHKTSTERRELFAFNSLKELVNLQKDA